jgi:hypothetical protein
MEPMKQFLRRSLEQLPGPLPLLTVEAVQFLRHPHVRHRKRLQRRVIRRIEGPRTVAQGPFQGMRYVSHSFGSAFLPKLMGTYERELNPAVEAICRARCDRIIDIGTAEGYYAVGMALRNADAQVVGFETSRAARFAVRRLARRNGLSGRIKLHGHCTPETLDAALAGARRPAVICDCEGGEDHLLRPDRVAPLTRALILVEIHEGALGDVGRRIAERFADTHEIEVIDSRTRSCEDLPAGYADLPPAEAAEALYENRQFARWFHMTPRPPWA